MNPFTRMQNDIESAASGVSNDISERTLEYVQHQWSLDQNWGRKLLELGRNGTNLAKNYNDPHGDGDQSKLTDKKAQLHRDFWCAGGDVLDLLQEGRLPDFIVACMTGNAQICRDLLLNSSNGQEKELMIEKRYSVLRFSALFFAIVGHVQVGNYPGKNNLEIVRILLSNGARVDARDLCGKTVLHYIMGPLCSPGDVVMKDIADVCIQHSIEKNMANPRLVDMQDRFGTVPLHQPIMMNRMDLIEFLCTKHLADGSIEDYENISPLSMCNLNHSIRSILNNARGIYLASIIKRECHYCHMTSSNVNQRCGRCKLVYYCSKDCQKLHWKAGHKEVCGDTNNPNNGFIIVPLAEETKLTTNINGETIRIWKGGPPPSDITIDEEFDVKIQVGPPGSCHRMDAMLYNKRRTLFTSIRSTNCSRYDDLCSLIHQFEPFHGRKAYFKAKLQDNGTLFVSSLQLFVKKW